MRQRLDGKERKGVKTILRNIGTLAATVKGRRDYLFVVADVSVGNPDAGRIPDAAKGPEA